MFFGNSDPTLIALFLTTCRREGESPAQVLEELNAEFHRHLVLPVKFFLHSLWAKIYRAVFTSRRASSALRRHRHLHAKQTDFELLAAYPVDRANPPAQQRLRFLTSRQHLLQARLQSGTIHMRPEILSWKQQQEIVFFEAEQACCKAEFVLAEKK